MTPRGDFRETPGNERFMILQMVQDGTISPDDGARLLEAMDRAERMNAITPPPPPAPASPRDVRILISDSEGNKDIDLSLPIGVVETGLKLANRIAPGRVPDLSGFFEEAHLMTSGTLLDINDGSQHIQITIKER